MVIGHCPFIANKYFNIIYYYSRIGLYYEILALRKYYVDVGLLFFI